MSIITEVQNHHPFKTGLSFLKGRGGGGGGGGGGEGEGVTITSPGENHGTLKYIHIFMYVDTEPSSTYKGKPEKQNTLHSNAI